MDHQPTATQTPDARDYLRPVWAHKFLIVVLVAAVTAGTYVYYDRQPDRFTASTDIYLDPRAGVQSILTGANVAVSDRELANQARLLKTLPVAGRVAKQLSFTGPPRALLDNVSVVADPNADFVTVGAASDTAKGAADMANAFAQAFIDQRSADRRRDAGQAVTAAQREYDQLSPAERRSPSAAELALSIRQLRVVQSIPSGAAEQLDPAAPPGAPVAPNPKKSAIFGAALALMLGIIAAFALERFDKRIKKVDAVEDLYDVPMLGAVPHARRVSPVKDGKPVAADGVVEAFRTIRTTLDLIDPRPDGRTLLVTSATPREGKSTVVRNLALVYGETGLKVAVVESDLRSPTLAKLFALQPGAGLGEVLAGRVELDEALQRVDVQTRGAAALAVAWSDAGNGSGYGHATGDGVGELAVLTAGRASANPATLLGSPRMRELLDELRRTYDVVLLDSPPLLSVSDGLHLHALADATLLVTRVRSTTHASAETVAEIASRIPTGRIIGVVANDVQRASVPYGYGEYEVAAT